MWITPTERHIGEERTPPTLSPQRKAHNNGTFRCTKEGHPSIACFFLIHSPGDVDSTLPSSRFAALSSTSLASVSLLPYSPKKLFLSRPP